MRVPGFFHRKGAPFQSRIVHECPRQPYTRDQLVAAFKRQINGHAAPPHVPGGTTYEPANFPPNTTFTGFLLPETQEELREALRFLDADSREQWVEAGAALHLYGDQGRHLWTEWSRRSAKFNERDQERVWRSFRDDRPGLTIRTLFAKAQRAGWVNPLANPAVDSSIPPVPEGVTGAPPPPPPADAGPGINDGDPELLDLSQLAKSEPEAPRFIVYPWLPENGPVLCAGHGGTSKSQLMLMLAVCIALELAFFGHACERRKVLFYSAEDSRDVLHWRLANICRALDVDLAALDGWLFIFDATAAESICYTDAADLGDRLTPRYRWLAAQIARHEIGVAFIDGVADVFDASENDRSKVKAFVRACMALVKPQRGSVVLIGHVNRPTAASPKSAEGYAGTTGWHNAVRARWYLRTEVAEDGQPESGACAPRILELQKSNYSPAGATLRLLWDAGKQVYTADVPEPAGGVVEAIRARNERRMILTLLAQCEAIGRNVAVSEKANSNAGVILGEREGFPASFRGRDGRKRLFRLLRQLEEDGLLRAETITTASRNRVDVWRLTDAGKKELAT